jgi:quinolinate synthase
MDTASRYVERLNALKHDRNAVIMAHYYAVDAVQDVADYLGDSFYLATVAAGLDAKVIVLAGVTFMGESAKVLAPDKTVLVPDVFALCPMAEMASVKDIENQRATTDDLAVVCYVNSTAQVKAVSDVCVTSSNAVKIVAKLPNKNIYFTPDRNLGAYIQSQLPNKRILTRTGFCCVHDHITEAEAKAAKAAHPDAPFLAHPECRAEVLALADYIGSTAGILDYATHSSKREFIVATETGIFHQLKAHRPDANFYTVSNTQFCKQMKGNTIEAIIAALENMSPEVTLPDDLIRKAAIPLRRMVELSA